MRMPDRHGPMRTGQISDPTVAGYEIGVSTAESGVLLLALVFAAALYYRLRNDRPLPVGDQR